MIDHKPTLCYNLDMLAKLTLILLLNFTGNIKRQHYVNN